LNINLYVILASRDGRTWMIEHSYGGAAIFFTSADASAHAEAIGASGIEYRIVELSVFEVQRLNA
jgi:hypothetical protein